jgi:hypothetical protein
VDDERVSQDMELDIEGRLPCRDLIDMVDVWGEKVERTGEGTGRKFYLSGRGDREQ